MYGNSLIQFSIEAWNYFNIFFFLIIESHKKEGFVIQISFVFFLLRFKDDLDSVSTVGNQQRTPTNSTYGSVPLAFAGGSALIETLQSSLKQRDGENHQLQWELSRLQSERNFLLSEVSSLTSQLEGVKLNFRFNFYSNFAKYSYNLIFLI